MAGLPSMSDELAEVRYARSLGVLIQFEKTNE
jgi:hypothetical protein